MFRRLNSRIVEVVIVSAFASFLAVFGYREGGLFWGVFLPLVGVVVYVYGRIVER